jgi:hypothetical protein
MGVSVIVSTPSPAPLGTIVQLDAQVSEAGEGTLFYRFRLKDPASNTFRVVRDFSSSPTFIWTPNLDEGLYELEITAWNRDTGEIGAQTETFLVEPTVAGGQPTITPTTHALVFRYSAPPCATGGRMKVLYTAGDGSRYLTPSRSCGSGNMNFLLAGLRADTEYSVRHVVETAGRSVEGPAQTLYVPPLPYEFARMLPAQPPSTPVTEGVLLQGTLFQLPVATDLAGNVVWYLSSEFTYLTRPEPGGYFFVLIERPERPHHEQVLRLVDVTGATVFEINAETVNHQLAALGKRQITSFHHEARSMPGGKILVLAATEQILENVQGSGPVNVLGDMILVLDRNLNVEWTWDAFDHLDIYRTAILDQKCTPGGGGCPAFYLTQLSNDWVHGNSLQLTPDGHILYSARHQDWVIKIDYSNGRGNGAVIWRLGKDGDFRFLSDDPWPWFSHQHDANYETADTLTRVLVFDNGNTRQRSDPQARSRGQVIELDEVNRTARLVQNFDLGAFARALGSAQRLSNGNYSFNVGWTPGDASYAIEFDPAGNITSKFDLGIQQYRSFRMKDIFTP